MTLLFVHIEMIGITDVQFQLIVYLYNNNIQNGAG